MLHDTSSMSSGLDASFKSFVVVCRQASPVPPVPLRTGVHGSERVDEARVVAAEAHQAMGLKPFHIPGFSMLKETCRAG